MLFCESLVNKDHNSQKVQENCLRFHTSRLKKHFRACIKVLSEATVHNSEQFSDLIRLYRLIALVFSCYL